MTQKLSGGCACGAIHYACNADPFVMFNCHCRDCQRASGGGYAAKVIVPKTAVQMRGELRYHKIVGSAGKTIERGFCPTCGSHVTDKLERLPNILALQAGSLDDPSMYRPMMDVFTSGARLGIIWTPRSKSTRTARRGEAKPLGDVRQAALRKLSARAINR